MDTTKRGESVALFAESLGLSRAYIYRSIKAGHGPNITKIGRRTVVLREDAEQYVKTLRQRNAGRNLAD